MLPHLDFFGFHLEPYYPLLLFYLIFALLTLRKWAWANGVPLTWKMTAFHILLCAYFAFTGAKLLYYLLDQNPTAFHQIFIPWVNNGRAFYGSLLFVPLSIFCQAWPYGPHIRRECWNIAAIICAMGYGVMRLACFAYGCCYGTISDVPWSVVYWHPDSAMPAPGIPVHPVQLYDSILGFGIYFYLIRRQRAGKSAWFPCLLLFALGRLVTENFRGDTDWGLGVVYGLTTNQWISVGILATLLMIYFVHRIVLASKPVAVPTSSSPAPA